jgi:hypothetical protein
MTNPSQKEEVVSLLKQVIKDDDARDMRGQHMSDRSLTQFMGVKFWYKRYPVSYARERLITRGSSVAPILLEIIQDQNYENIHFVAWKIYGQLAPPMYLKEVYQAGKQGRLLPDDVSALVNFFLPVLRSKDYWQKDKVMDWLGKQLADKSFDQIVLDAMDDYLKAEDKDGGMFPGVIDENVLRWLGWIYDVNLDSWLAAKAPSVLKFRMEQLSRGYDPATSFNLDSNLSYGLLDEAMVAIYPQLQDQKACKDLLEAVCPILLTQGVRSPLQPQPTDGWERRLKDWYWSQRPSLRYDPSLLRFVPKAERAVSRPASAPKSE